MLKQRQQVFVTLLAGWDATVVVCACIVAWLVRVATIDGALASFRWPQSLRDWIQQPLLVFAVPIALTSMRVFGLYRPWRDKRMLAEARAILNASLVTIVSLIVLLWGLGSDIMGGSDPSRMVKIASVRFDAAKLQLVCLSVLLPLLLMLERAAFRAVLRELRRRGKNLRHVAIIGTGRLARIACRTLDRNAWTGIHVAYFVDHHEHERVGEGERADSAKRMILDRLVVGHVGQLETVLERRPIDAVYLAVPNVRAAMIPSLIQRLDRFPVDVRIIPDVSPRYSPLSMQVNELEGMPILSIRENPMEGVAGAVKRMIDVMGAIGALVVFGLPMIVIALVVKLSSPGPVIFRQRRVSIGGEEFNILKFRTMRTAEEEQAGAHWTKQDDPRVTSIGRMLRRTSLDELPQLFNVLLGDMSLVGPRPERPELIAKFREDWRGYMLRQHVKAGMTGWAQINGYRGNTGLRKRLQHDLFYIRHWSLAFDLKILWLTLFRGFVHRNAH